MKDGIREKLETLPAEPGVYIFRDKEKNVIYVGKAKALSNRVRSYFQAPAAGDYKGQALRREISDLEVTVCQTEVDALILESTLIKKYRPRFNVILRDDKSYPYIAVSVSDEFPRVYLTRGKRVKGVKYYGPYVNARAARNTIRLLHKVFPLRHCTGRAPGQKSHSPCLYYDMHMCLGPCRGDVTPQQYRYHVKQFCDFLEGRYSEVLDELDSRMRAAAREEEYEEAARIRNQIESANQVLRHNRALSSSTTDYDVIGVFHDETKASFSIAQNRGGFHLGNLCFLTDLQDEVSEEELVNEFLKRYYDESGSIPELVVVPALQREEEEAITQWLAAQRGANVKIRVPVRGKKRSELSLAGANAKLALEGAKLESARDKGRIEAAMARLAKDLDLAHYPLRIECYDISTMGGAASVGSLVVFQDGRPARRDYRKFSIKFIPGVDDVGMMREVLYRRFKRYLSDSQKTAKEKEDARGWAKKPDLVLLDGGKGQLGAARDVFSLLGIEGVETAALAKRLEEIYLPERSKPVLLPRDSDALFLLQRIRDEAHRVAVSYHRSLMGKATSSSWLDQVSGVGPGRKKLLVRHFGSPKRVLEASFEDISAVPGLPEKVAEAVFLAAARIRENADEKSRAW
jgi:excinuclease ABC subunit C